MKCEAVRDWKINNYSNHQLHKKQIILHFKKVHSNLNHEKRRKNKQTNLPKLGLTDFSKLLIMMIFQLWFNIFAILLQHVAANQNKALYNWVFNHSHFVLTYSAAKQLINKFSSLIFKYCFLQYKYSHILRLVSYINPFVPKVIFCNSLLF